MDPLNPPPEDENARALALGDAAARTLADAELGAAHALLRADLHAQWEACQAPCVREAIWQKLNGLNAARGQLHAHVAAARDLRARAEAAHTQRRRDAERARQRRPALTR